MTRRKVPKLSATELHRYIRFTEDGRLWWLTRTPDMFKDGKCSAEASCNRWNGRYAGREAFTTVDGDGYRQGAINGRSDKAHRVIYALVKNYWPPDQIDHVNGDKADNRPENLRATTNSGNQRNQRGWGLSEFVGVYWNKNAQKWHARIEADGVRTSLGHFTTELEAVNAREAAERELFGQHGFAVSRPKEYARMKAELIARST